MMHKIKKILTLIGIIIVSCLVAILLSWYRTLELLPEKLCQGGTAFMIGIIFSVFNWKRKNLLLFLIPNVMIYLFICFKTIDTQPEQFVELLIIYIFVIVGYHFIPVSKKSILNLIGALAFLLLTVYFIEPYIFLKEWEQGRIESGIIKAVGADLQKEYFLDKDSNRVYMDQFKDDVILIDIWNKSCYICYKKYKMLVDFAKEYKDEKVKFLIVYSKTNQEPENFEDFVTELNRRKMQDYPNVINLYDPDTTINKRFQIHTFPTEMIVYNDTIRDIFAGYNEDTKWLIKRELRIKIDKWLEK